MLVRFHSKATGAVTLFGEVAIELLRLMGASGAVPGALLAEDVPGALDKLNRAVASSEGDRIVRPRQSMSDEDEQEETVAIVNLRTRAYPLLQLLETAAAEDCAVVWEDSSKATG